MGYVNESGGNTDTAALAYKILESITSYQQAIENR